MREVLCVVISVVSTTVFVRLVVLCLPGVGLLTLGAW